MGSGRGERIEAGDAAASQRQDRWIHDGQAKQHGGRESDRPTGSGLMPESAVLASGDG